MIIKLLGVETQPTTSRLSKPNSKYMENSSFLLLSIPNVTVINVCAHENAKTKKKKD